jgi:hypothetical protein
MVCENCKSGECVIGIDTLFRIVRIHSRHYMYASCCGAVVQYLSGVGCFQNVRKTSALHKDQKVGMITGQDICNPYVCVHAFAVSKPLRTKRVQCFACRSPVIQRVYDVVDIETQKLVQIRCCGKHCPPAEKCKNIVLYKDFVSALEDMDDYQTQRKMKRFGIHRKCLTRDADYGD